MKTKLVCAMACAAAFMAMTAPAMSDQPIGWYGALDLGIASRFVAVENGNGSVIHPTLKDKNTAVFSKLAPGHYTLVIDGPNLIAAMDKIAPPPAPQKKKSSSSFSIGIGGGMSGGGGSHGDAKGEQGGGSARGEGGVGLGVNIPVGGGGKSDPDSGGAAIQIQVSYTHTSSRNDVVQPKDLQFSHPDLTVEAPYCRDNAQQGLRVGFTVPEGSEVDVRILAGATKAKG